MVGSYRVLRYDQIGEFNIHIRSFSRNRLNFTICDNTDLDEARVWRPAARGRRLVVLGLREDLSCDDLEGILDLVRHQSRGLQEDHVVCPRKLRGLRLLDLAPGLQVGLVTKQQSQRLLLYFKMMSSNAMMLK